MADAVFLACMFIVIGVVSALGVWAQVNETSLSLK